MKLIILSVVLLLAFSSLNLGQGNAQRAPAPAAKCTLTLAQAPELRGIRLGINQAQVVARFPGLSIDRPDKLGESRVRLNLMAALFYQRGTSTRDRAVQADIASGTADTPSFTVDGSRFPDLKGVRKIQLRFVDGRLAYVMVGYDDSVKWDGVDDFVDTVAKILGLPRAWQVPRDSDSIGKAEELRCDGFLMTATLGGDTTDSSIAAQLSLEDTALTQMVEKRQNDQKEKARREDEDRRKAFKP